MDNQNRKRPFILKLFTAIGIFLLALFLLLAAGLAYSHFDREETFSHLPKNFSLYLHADSAWDAAIPLLELNALDQILTTQELSDARNTVMTLRASGIKNNKLLSLLAARQIDGAFYLHQSGSVSYLAELNLGYLSLFTRTLPFYYSFIKPLKGLSYNSEGKFFMYQAGKKIFYAAVRKNLVLVTEDFELFNESLLKNNSDYSEEQLAILKEKSSEPVKIVASAGRFLELFAGDVPLVKKLTTLVSSDALCTVLFKITNEEIDVDVKLPLSENGAEEAILQTVLNKNSTLPLLLSRLNENVQYYTILNSVTLEELKNEIFPLMQETQDMDSIWKTASSLSEAFFHVTLEELLFSWTGNEFAVLGIENHNDPVFVLQIKDEKQRQKIFNSVISSIIINSNDSLILDGVRLPRLELPKFIQSLLKLFDISLPAPYYLVRNGFICFSENPEALSAIYKSTGKLNKLSTNESWLSVSEKQTPESTVSLFYDLNRTMPFFLRSKASLSKVLSLYAIGRTDFCISDRTLSIHLSAVSRPRPDDKNISGFPVMLEGKTDGLLVLSKEIVKTKTRKLFWVEDHHVIHSMDIPSLKMDSIDAVEECFIVPDKSPDKNGLLWVVTETGQISLLNSKLENVSGFPILSGENVEVAPSVTKDGIVFVTDRGSVVFADFKGKIRKIDLPVNGSLRSEPAVYNDPAGYEVVAVYDKSFIGQLFFIVNRQLQDSMTISVPGIAYGSPSLTYDGIKNLEAGFVTQDGNLNIYSVPIEDILTATEISSINIQLEEGTFNVNTVSDGSYFYVLSTDAVLTRISRDGELLSVKLPYMTARDGRLMIIDGNIYVSPDGNLIYGFDRNLELLLSFPLEGRGSPVFTDVNGDRKPDFFSLSIDNKLNAWNVRF